MLLSAITRRAAIRGCRRAGSVTRRVDAHYVLRRSELAVDRLQNV